MKVRLRDPKTPKMQTKKFRPLRRKYTIMKNISTVLLIICICQAIYITFNNLK